MRLVSLVKTPAETSVHTIDLGGRGGFSDAATIVPRGLVAETAPLAAEPLLVSGNLELRLSGGSDGEVYAVSVPVTLTDGQTIEAAIEISTIAGYWAMPDGGAPMLSVAAFVARVGLDQVLRLTDMGDGRIDQGLVIGALIDAQAQVEANLAGRYALPLDPVPTLVSSIITDLAHAGLFQHEVPENVETKRKIALRNLEALRKGDLRLGTGAREQSAKPSDPVRFDKGSRAYPDGLKDYSFR